MGKKSCDLCTVKHCDDSKKYSFKCPTWANFGECHKRPNFMKKYCKKSCNLCTGAISPHTTPATPKPITGCKDKLDTCPAWKKEGECTKVQSQNFMKKYCAKTCNKCPGEISTTTISPAGEISTTTTSQSVQAFQAVQRGVTTAATTTKT